MIALSSLAHFSTSGGVILTIALLAILCVALEEKLKINKEVPVLIGGGITVLILLFSAPEIFGSVDPWMKEFGHFFGIHSEGSYLRAFLSFLKQFYLAFGVVGFIFCLLLMAAIAGKHGAFKVMGTWIKARSMTHLLIITGVMSFFLSATLDNVAAEIVIITLLALLVKDKKQLLMLIGYSVIVNNAGGAWSPVGDATTTLLWLAGKVSPGGLVVNTLIPSIITALVATVFYWKWSKKQTLSLSKISLDGGTNVGNAKTMLWTLFIAILSIPIGKITIHAINPQIEFPPVILGMIALGFVWLVSEKLDSKADTSEAGLRTAARAIEHLESGILAFFLGLLTMIGMAEESGGLHWMSEKVNHGLAWLGDHVWAPLNDQRVAVVLYDFMSAVVDNVAMVATSLGLFSSVPKDDALWHFVAHGMGTMGSAIVFGSAAGVAAMGMKQLEGKLDFAFWTKNVMFPAIVASLAGIIYQALVIF